MSGGIGSALAAGYVADALLGDPRRWHPVAGFGQLVLAVERRAWADDRVAGTAFAVGLVGAVVALTTLLQRWASVIPGGRRAITAAITWAALGQRSLLHEGATMQDLLVAGELEGARRRLSHLCGRDPSTLDEVGLVRATVESLAENTSDAVVAPFVWGAVGGAPAIAGYRALNTLDAMVGSRTSRYRRFGWAAARADDVANWVPSRLTALLAAVLAPLLGGRPVDALRVWRRDAPAHPSPNAGPVEASFAGALGIRLGGTTNTYGDHQDRRPPLGDGREVRADDIARAAALGRRVGLAALVLCSAVAVRREGGR